MNLRINRGMIHFENLESVVAKRVLWRLFSPQLQVKWAVLNLLAQPGLPEESEMSILIDDGGGAAAARWTK
jgi:hypothetical protein